jgi:hypothetical protein
MKISGFISCLEQEWITEALQETVERGSSQASPGQENLDD